MIVPIFPLPETVFFPSVPLPLHLFEPRYVQMAEDVLAGDRLMVVVLLRPGWQSDYYGTPSVHDIATLGRIDVHERLPDGRFHIVLQGLERVRLLAPESAERAEGKLYRVREVRPAPESRLPAGVTTTALSERLRSRWRELEEMSGKERAKAPPEENLPFEALVNRIASLVDVPPERKQSLLEEDDLLARAAALELDLERSLRFWRSLARFRRYAPTDPRVN